MLKKRIAAFMVLAMLVSMFSGLALFAGAAEESSDEDLVVWYKFDQVNGNVITDASGNGKNATIVGGVTIGNRGTEKAAVLDGSTGYLQLPQGIVSGLTNITVSAWVYINNTQAYQRIFDFGSNTTRYMYLLASGRNDAAYGFASGITTSGWTNERTTATGVDLPEGEWAHVAFVQSGTTVRLYQNGAKVAENTSVDLNPSSLGNTTNNFIGKSQFSGDATFDGSISDFRIYKKALTDGEIGAIAGIDDEYCVQMDKEAIYIGNIFTIESDLVLPTQGVWGSNISWSSSNPDIISNTGKVTRPAAGQPNAEVILTATITKGVASDTREFVCTVLAELTDQAKAEADAAAINLGDTSSVASDLTLPTVGATYGSAIAWESSDPSIIAADGKVTRPEYGQGDATVTLTATVTNGTTGEAVRNFTVTVLQKEFVLTISEISEVNVSTIVGNAPSLPDTVVAIYNDNSRRMLPVVWDSIDESKYARSGFFKVEGTVGSTNIKAVANVTVNTFDINTSFNMSQLTPGSELIATVNATNGGSESATLLEIVVLYDAAGRMRDVVYSSKEIQPGETEVLSGTITLPGDVAGWTAKVFVWSGSGITTSSLQPQAKVAELLSEPQEEVKVPDVPGGLTAEADISSVSISWDEVPGADGYDIEVDGTVISDVTSPYEHTGLVYNSTHTYSVRAKNSAGVSPWSVPLTVTLESGGFGDENLAVKPFDLSEVTLLTSPFTANRDRTVNYLKSCNDDSMLYVFRVTAGLDTKGASPLGGWDAPDSKLRGHTTGHYLLALSQAYAETQDTELKAKIDYLVAELAKCQEALPSRSNDMGGFNNEGYLAGYPEKQFIRLEAFARYGSGPDDVWAPYYTNHKIMSGLIAAYKLAGNTQALEIVTKMGDWVYGRLSKCTREQLDTMWGIYIAGEYGGMNEVMSELYNITGDQKYVETAKFFDNTALFNATAQNNDTLNGKHANQHIPQMTGALRVFDATNEQYYYNIAKNFWDMVVEHRMYCIGGTSQGEMFRQRDRIAQYISSDTCETCCTYNLLKLTRALFFHDPQPKYMDYYERALYNDILASQRQSGSGHNVTYFMPLNPGAQKGFGNGYTCCAGTGMENHTKYQDSIYFKSADENTLYVNLYVPSTLNWSKKGFKITQQTNWPSEQSSRLTVNEGGQLDIKFRVPYWSGSDFSITINGVEQEIEATAGSYVTVSRKWEAGDEIVVSFPYSFRVEPTPDDSSVIALFYGPILLVGKDDRTSYINLTLNMQNLSESITPVAGQPFTFTTNGVTLVPMYTASGFRYHAYFKRTQ